MPYPLKHRFTSTRLSGEKNTQDTLIRFATESLAEVLEVIDQQVACDQWVEAHLARQGIPAPSPQQVENGWLRLVEMLAVSMAFEHPHFSKVMAFVDRHEDVLFDSNHSKNLATRHTTPANSPLYMGKPIYDLVEGFSEQLIVTKGQFAQTPQPREVDGQVRDLGLFCRYRGPIWNGELDMLVRQGDWGLVEGLQDAGLIDDREGFFVLATCEAQRASKFRNIFTGSPVIGEEELSFRFREMLRCAAAPCTHTLMPDARKVSYVREQLEILGNSQYAKGMLAYDFYAISNEIQSAHEAYGLDNQKLFQMTLRSLSAINDDFYRHVAIAFFDISAGKAMAPSFTLSEFSKHAVKAFLQAYKLDDSRSSPDLAITKAVLLMVNENDFEVPVIDSSQLRILYRATGFAKLASGMNASDLATSLEEDLGL